MKYIIFLFLLIFFTSCDTITSGRYAPTIYNAYYKNLYEETFFEKSLEYDINLSSLKVNRELTLGMFHDSKDEYKLKRVNLYYKNKQCLLFSYNLKDFKKMWVNAGYTDEDADRTRMIFLIKKNGASIISREEFEKIRDTFIPYKLEDKSMCKNVSNDE